MEAKAADVFEHYSWGECKVLTDYSGRGMYGKETHAVIFANPGDFYKTIGDIMGLGDEEERENVRQALKTIRSDNMGLGMVYY